MEEKKSSKSHTELELIERAGREAMDLYRWLQAVKAGKVKVQKAPTNQFYKVGWASNDNI